MVHWDRDRQVQARGGDIARAFFGFALFTGRSLGASFDDGWCETAALPWALRRSRLDVVAFGLAVAAPSFELELKTTYI
ncbi:hypothetical protein ACVWXN_010854 [Bradyrhizobium sp. i1.4.4]|uniref:hypothetical protein n=1 Tax=unclassified Bradyrhizobium TaxID=2631580 RepID=UPI00339836B8